MKRMGLSWKGIVGLGVLVAVVTAGGVRVAGNTEEVGCGGEYEEGEVDFLPDAGPDDSEFVDSVEFGTAPGEHLAEDSKFESTDKSRPAGTPSYLADDQVSCAQYRDSACYSYWDYTCTACANGNPGRGGRDCNACSDRRVTRAGMLNGAGLWMRFQNRYDYAYDGSPGTGSSRKETTLRPW